MYQLPSVIVRTAESSRSSIPMIWQNTAARSSVNRCYAAGLPSTNKDCFAAWLTAATAGCVSRRSTEMA